MIRRLSLLVCVLGWLAATGAVESQAASAPVTRIYVSPAYGYPSSLVQVKGTYATIGACHAPPLFFSFAIDGRSFWSQSVSYCAPQSYVWDTGLSPSMRLPVSTVGMHTVMVRVSYAGAEVSGGSATWAYRIYQAPASPAPSQSPGAASSAAPSPVSSPVPTCTLAARPARAGASMPPIGLALVGIGPLIAFARRRRLLLILGLALLSTAMLGCSSTSVPVAASAPSASPACVQA
jgi:hypothetical protein